MPPSYEDLVTRSGDLARICQLDRQSSYIESAAISPDSAMLACGAEDGSVSLWRLPSGELLRRMDSPISKGTCDAYSLAFSPSSDRLAVAYFDEGVWIWEAATGRRIQVLKAEQDPIFCVRFCPRGELLAAGMHRGQVRVWDLSRDAPSTALSTEGHGVCTMDFSTDGQRLVAGTDQGELRIWEVRDWTPACPPSSVGAKVLSMAHSPDGRWLAVGLDSCKVKLCEPTSGQEVRSLDPPHWGGVTAVAWTPDSRVLISRANNDHQGVSFWDVRTARRICSLPQLSEQRDSRWVTRALDTSSDGRLLAAYAARSVLALDLWDISPLGSPIEETPDEVPTTAAQGTSMPLNLHLWSVPLSHGVDPSLPAPRPAQWLQAAGPARVPLPLFLARDLGILLGGNPSEARFRRPAYLPADEMTGPYEEFFVRAEQLKVIRELRGSSIQLSDPVMALLLTRVVQGARLPAEYAPPGGRSCWPFIRALSTRLEEADMATVWRQTATAKRPSCSELMTPEVLVHLEQNLRDLHTDEIRFLAHYGPPPPFQPDPRIFLDLLAMQALPPVARRAILCSVRMLPRVCAATRSSGGQQSYPEGGYQGISRDGSLDSLLAIEAAYPRSLFLHRVLNNEALYYGRESPPERRSELAYIVVQSGLGLGGDRAVLCRALLLALNREMATRGHEVLYSFAGERLTEPRPLDTPEEIWRMLYYQEKGRVDEPRVLRGVHASLKGWREAYRTRRVMWVLDEHFDADRGVYDDVYAALRAEAEHSAWFVCTATPGQKDGQQQAPFAARYLRPWQVVETSIMWED